MGIVAGVFRERARLNAVKRRQGQIQTPLTDQVRHGAIEEGDQQGGNVRTVHVGVGHDDDTLIAQVIDAETRTGLNTQSQHQIGQFDVLT